MASKKTALQKLQESKQLLKKQIEEQEKLIQFENAKQSFSTITHGFTDKYLRNEPSDDGSIKTVVNKGTIAKEIGNTVKEKLLNRDMFTQIVNGGMKGNNIEGLLKTGIILGMSALAKKKMKSGGIKNKIIGAVLLYAAPFALRFAQKKINEYQQKKSITSLEKII